MGITLQALHAWLRQRLGEAEVRRSGSGPVARLALALEAVDLPPDLKADALFLHRANRLGEAFSGLAVLNSHDGFDLSLTTGPNLALAQRLGWHDIQLIELERASGLSAQVPQRDWDTFVDVLSAELGGYEQLRRPREPELGRVVLMNAMRPELLHTALEQGATVYITGQMRPVALGAARELGMGVVALGHRRSEEWGLRQLKRELEAAFPELSCIVYP
jgi:putative NIF3 family GTP cyclohydrolase 1 type 2